MLKMQVECKSSWVSELRVWEHLTNSVWQFRNGLVTLFNATLLREKVYFTKRTISKYLIEVEISALGFYMVMLV